MITTSAKVKKKEMTVIQIFNVQSVSLVSISDAQFKKKKTKTAQVMRIVRTVLDVLALGNVLRISHFMSETIVRNPCCVRQWRTMNLDIVRSLR